VKPAPDPRRLVAFGLGLRAETRAAWWLRLKGYRILARRCRFPVGEIDLVARRGRLVAFVEVKARRDADLALEAVGPRTRRRIVAASELWMQGHPELSGHDRRFDVVVVVPRRLPVHHAGAYIAGD
jgi:putative endonuclease